MKRGREREKERDREREGKKCEVEEDEGAKRRRRRRRRVVVVVVVVWWGNRVRIGAKTNSRHHRALIKVNLRDWQRISPNRTKWRRPSEERRVGDEPLRRTRRSPHPPTRSPVSLAERTYTPTNISIYIHIYIIFVASPSKEGFRVSITPERVWFVFCVLCTRGFGGRQAQGRI